MVGDEEFAKMGFKRRKGSLDYVRLIGDAKQIININGTCWPNSNPNFEFKIFPYIRLSMKKITDIITPILGGEWAISNAPNVIFAEPMYWFAPQPEKISDWYSNGLEDFKRNITEICKFTKKWVIPFLDKMTTIDDIIDFYNIKDNKLLRGERWYLRVAAAYLYKNDLQGVQKILEENLGKLGQRMRYASVYRKLGIDPKIPK